LEPIARGPSFSFLNLSHPSSFDFFGFFATFSDFRYQISAPCRFSLLIPRLNFFYLFRRDISDGHFLHVTFSYSSLSRTTTLDCFDSTLSIVASSTATITVSSITPSTTSTSTSTPNYISHCEPSLLATTSVPSRALAAPRAATSPLSIKSARAPELERLHSSSLRASNKIK